MGWIWALLAGGALFFGGFVTRCTTEHVGDSTSTSTATSIQTTKTKTTVMQGQVMILMQNGVSNWDYFSINFNDITNMQISRTNMKKMVVTNGKTNW